MHFFLTLNYGIFMFCLKFKIHLLFLVNIVKNRWKTVLKYIKQLIYYKNWESYKEHTLIYLNTLKVHQSLINYLKNYETMGNLIYFNGLLKPIVKNFSPYPHKNIVVLVLPRKPQKISISWISRVISFTAHILKKFKRI